jgi:transcriptional regulator with XRE-family HTH domain
MVESKVIPMYAVRLKHFRKNQLHLTQSDFAEIIGTTKSQYSKMENGLVGFTFEHIMKLHQAFSVNPIWLWYGTGKPQI